MSIFSTILGNATRDAEVKTFGQNQVVKFSLASNKKTKEGDSTTFVNCSWFGNRAIKFSQYITKGGKFLAVGELTQREYNGKQYLELDVTNVEFAGSKRGASSNDSAPSGSGNYPAPGGGLDDEDSLPF
jgi:single-strand DNA-binding protein